VAKEIAEAQGAFRGIGKSCWTVTSKTTDFTCHMRLIGVAHRCGRIRNSGTMIVSLCQIQEPLKTKHRLKHFRTIANCSSKSPMELSFADAHRATEFLYLAMGLPSKPVHTAHNSSVGRGKLERKYATESPTGQASAP